MSVELTPAGTRGRNMPKLPRPLMKGLMTLGYWFMRLRGTQLLTLTTAGSRTGNLHTVPLSCFPAPGGAWLVVASFGGTAKHPAWYVNLAKHPDQVWVTRGGRKWQVRPESLQGAERADAWQRLVAVAPGYAGYQEQTDREIPVVRLTPLAPGKGTAG